VYFLDPLRVRFSLNPLELPAESTSREIAVEKMIGEITEFFKKLYGRQYWGLSLNRIFQEGLRALYERDDSPTLKDLHDLVSGKIRHEEFENELKKNFHVAELMLCSTSSLPLSGTDSSQKFSAQNQQV